MLRENLVCFEKRFPELARSLQKAVNTALSDTGAGTVLFPIEDILVCEAKNTEITASYKGVFLHSAYNPSAEAQKMLQSDDIKKADTIVFFGAGLGYGPAKAAAMYKNKTIVVIEPNPIRLLWSFSLFDWHTVFEVPSCVFLLNAGHQSVIAVLEHFGLQDCGFIIHKAWISHAQQYFSEIRELIERNKDKQLINERTLEKFGSLWLSNICKNLRFTAGLTGINEYKDSGTSLPFCILAAGPGLDDILPLLPELKKRMVLICVDTALRSCLRAGTQPHFIVVVDPQYWNARHIADLQAPESILITESAAYPSVFRFKCRKIVLCASMFPLGRYIEQFTGKKEKLAAGGSVASTAWDFARFCGAQHIYTAGLDLSYPANKTHARGSTFEENAHYVSGKLHNSETQNASVIYNNPAFKNDSKTCDYNGNPVLSDARMQLYAWWFESKCAAFPRIKTYTLSSTGLCIPGIRPEKAENVLRLPAREQKIKDFCFGAEGETQKTYKNDFGTQTDLPAALQKAVDSLLADMDELKNLSESAIRTCMKICKTEQEYMQVLTELDKIDEKIRISKAAAIASLVFPPPSTLEKIIAEQLPPEPSSKNFSEQAKYNIAKSKQVYKTIINSIDTHIAVIKKNI
ncbi:motility associated factor glycosyltransferase family protein [Treponema sp. OMZ 840]|uniref:motility associated factor glycosyltransferase family protein n=1 Tax=Treponema sp. OMZ 840 TaxID=244313 RepID=UPI003D8F9633